MHKSILIFLFSLSFAFSEDNSYSWVKKIPKPWVLSQKNLNTYLKNFHREFPNFHDRLIALNLWRIGTPYGIFCLGSGSSWVFKKLSAFSSTAFNHNNIKILFDNLLIYIKDTSASIFGVKTSNERLRKAEQAREFAYLAGLMDPQCNLKQWMITFSQIQYYI